MTYKIGTVCIISDNDKTFQSRKDMVIGKVTQKSMLQLSPTKQREKLSAKVLQNLKALHRQLCYISIQPIELRMFRISSGLLPMFDHPDFKHHYDDKLLFVVDHWLAKCKLVIDSSDIRVCCHPDQYTIINSDREEVRLKAFANLEYHKYFMERLTTAKNSCINIHLNGKLDHIPEFDKGLYSHLKPWLSFENCDKKGTKFVGDTENTLRVCEKYQIRMLLDLHHDHVMNSDYIDINSFIMDRIVATWGGVRPIFHLSQGKEYSTDNKHRDFITNTDLITYSANFLSIGDIEVEAKGKNYAVNKFFNDVQKCD